MIGRKDLGLLILIIVVGTVVAIINPRFLSPINLAPSATAIGMRCSVLPHGGPATHSPVSGT